MVFCPKKQNKCDPEELKVGDCWIGISLTLDTGLIIAACVGKHTDRFLSELVCSTEGKTDCKCWDTDGWAGYARVLGAEIEHHIGKELTQRLERTNSILRQQTGRWHRKQNKFGNIWSQTEIATRLVVSYFNWIWSNIRWGTTASMRAGLTSRPWSWNELVSYPTVI